jgi:hypothetical protein
MNEASWRRKVFWRDFFGEFFLGDFLRRLFLFAEILPNGGNVFVWLFVQFLFSCYTKLLNSYCNRNWSDWFTLGIDMSIWVILSITLFKFEFLLRIIVLTGEKEHVISMNSWIAVLIVLINTPLRVIHQYG